MLRFCIKLLSRVRSERKRQESQHETPPYSVVRERFNRRKSDPQRSLILSKFKEFMQ